MSAQWSLRVIFALFGLAIALAPAVAQSPSVSGIVIRVIDGDTIEVEGVGKVRLIGIDTPETVDTRRPVQNFGREASAYTSQHLLGHRVRLEFDWQRLDKYGRTLAYIYANDDQLFNSMIIRDGYAFAYTKYPFKYREAFIRYEREAQESKKGLWADEVTKTH
jgi:micrococcal nuclease